MKTIDIAPSQWGHFCERLTEFHHGALIDLQIEEPDGGSRVVLTEGALRSMVFQRQTGHCSDLILIEIDGPGDRGLRQQQVVEPIHIRLKDGKNNRYNHIHILAESGNNIVTMRPGLDPKLANEFSAANQTPAR